MVRYAAEFGMTLRRVPASQRHRKNVSKKTKPPAISDAATQYAQEVVSGKRIAGPHVRGQCARHLQDIEDRHKRGLVWNVEESEKAQGLLCRCAEAQRR